MNLFVLDADPEVAAVTQCDKHIVKMPLEAVQLLSTASHKLNLRAPYKPNHVKHPCTLWLLESSANIEWTMLHAQALFREYSARYNRTHASEVAFRSLDMYGLLDAVPGDMTPFKLCMPEQYKRESAVESYRAYYLGDKARFAKWSKSDPPEWWVTSDVVNNGE